MAGTGTVDELVFVYFQSYLTRQHLQKEKYETPALGVLELAWPVVTAVLIQYTCSVLSFVVH